MRYLSSPSHQPLPFINPLNQSFLSIRSILFVDLTQEQVYIWLYYDENWYKDLAEENRKRTNGKD